MRRKSYLAGCLALTLVTLAISEESDDYEFSGGCAKENSAVASAEGGCKEIQSGVVWGPTPSEPKTYDEAVKFCATLSNGRWKEWRLPRQKEISRAVALGIARDGLPRSKTLDFFWVHAPSNVEVKRVAQLVEDESADRAANDRAATICVRQGVEKGLGCVTPETNYFITADGGCVYKKLRLAFSQRSRTAKSLGTARNYCSDLVEGAKSDWRLPKLPELTAIAWDGGADEHFKFNVNGDFWTDSQREEQAWSDAEHGGFGKVQPIKIKVQHFNWYACWVNLRNGKTGFAKTGSASQPHHANGYPIPGLPQFHSNQHFDISGISASVVCVRP